MTVDALAVARVLGVGVGSNVGGVPRQAAIPIPPLPPLPPLPPFFVMNCVEDTGNIGDGTFYIHDGYCFGFGGVAVQIELPQAEYVEII